MLINKSNYELFALDYIEGNLNARERKAMKAFLQAHPDLEAEIESMQVAMFTFEADEHIVYENKASLLKEVTETPVVFMQPRPWYRLAAAAAVAILLIGFGVGYFAGSISNEGEGIAVEDTKTKEEIHTTPTVIPAPIEQEAIAKMTEVSDNKIIIPNKQPQINKQKDEKPLIMQKSINSALATLEVNENEVQAIDADKVEIDLVTEELDRVERTEVVAISPLPKLEINITINSIQSTPESSALMSSDSKDWIANLNADSRFGNKLSKIKGFIGKLPFEDATLDAFVPTYFANADSD